MSFIYSKQRLELPYLDAYCEYCQFDLSQFQYLDFGCLGIVCPEGVASSVPKRQADYLAGRFLAKSVLLRIGHYTGQVGRGASREAIWPSGVIGSISHNDGSAVCVAALNEDPHAGIGVDIERLIAPEIYQSFVGIVIDPAEKQKVIESGVDNRLLYTLIFSAKEAIFKALFPQVGRYFDFLDVSFCAYDNHCLDFVLNTALSPDLSAGSRIHVYRHPIEHGVLCYTHSEFVVNSSHNSFDY